jgi:hypothetical protein
MGCSLGGSLWLSYVTCDASDIAESRRRLEADVVYPKWFALSTVPCIASVEGAISGVAAHVVFLGGVPQWFIRFVLGAAPVVYPDQTDSEHRVLGRRNADGRISLPVTSGWPTPQSTTETRRGVGTWGVFKSRTERRIFRATHTHRPFRFHATMLRSFMWLKLAATAAALFNFTHTQYGTARPSTPRVRLPRTTRAYTCSILTHTAARSSGLGGWEAARERAQAFVAQLTLDEKAALVTGEDRSVCSASARAHAARRPRSVCRQHTGCSPVKLCGSLSPRRPSRRPPGCVRLRVSSRSVGRRIMGQTACSPAWSISGRRVSRQRRACRAGPGSGTSRPLAVRRKELGGLQPGCLPLRRAR